MVALERLRILITGVVQGVGFRPHVYRIANQLNLTGWVQNNGSGVAIEIQGQNTAVFLTQLIANLPTLAKITKIHTTSIDLVQQETNFQIAESKTSTVHTTISPDTAICTDCLNELFDPNSHYNRYPFLNCIHCGPRLSITRQLPYDRCQTTMDEFPLCADCKGDYLNPSNRRYHAQPTACLRCGPQLSHSIDEIYQAIRQGKIIALKGLGGYQLICDARNEHAILKLRQRKNREAKPFALMMANLLSAETIVHMDDNEKTLLTNPARPIVLLRKKTEILPQTIAPLLSHLGIMLPGTPLYYLLFNAFANYPNGCKWLDTFQSTVLVVTSANVMGNPLIIEDADAAQELKKIADTIVTYNRQIVIRLDDSVVRVIHHTPCYIRRARGYVPTSIPLAHAIPSTLALGAHLKNTFCITREDEAFVSQHIGSLNNPATIAFFHESLKYLLKFLDVTPERIAHDLHPDFYTTRFAQDFCLPTFPIQHHHAHLASVAAEHAIVTPTLGLALDGYGYGSDGSSWGGELMLLENTECIRLGSFDPLAQPGGDLAAREPWRMAASVLNKLGKRDEIAQRFPDQPHAKMLATLFEKKFPMPLTHSCGRLFDAASALLNINALSQYEGQAAMQLESKVTKLEIVPNGWHIAHQHFSLLPTFNHLLTTDAISGANLFHGTLIAGLTAWILFWAERTAVYQILLSGGCFLNKVLTEGLIQNLTTSRLKVLFPKQLPPNDGGIALGQAWIAGNMSIEDEEKVCA